MDVIWQQIITLLGGYTIFMTAVAWLVKTITSHALLKDIEKYKAKLDNAAKLRDKELENEAKSRDKDLESYKDQLQLQLNVALEQVKADLQIKAKENEIRFTKLHEKRSEVILDFYGQLEEIYRDTAVLMLKPKRDLSKHIEPARKLWIKCGQVSEFFQKNKLYFSKNLANEIENLLSIISEPSDAYVFSPISDATDKGMLETLEEWGTKKQDAERERIRKLIEDEFREMLGAGK